MMSKKDFEYIAHAIKNSPADRDTFIDIIVDLCADSNPDFDENRFRLAAGQIPMQCGCWIFTHEGDEPHSWVTGNDCHLAFGHHEGDAQ